MEYGTSAASPQYGIRRIVLPSPAGPSPVLMTQWRRKNDACPALQYYRHENHHQLHNNDHEHYFNHLHDYCFNRRLSSLTSWIIGRKSRWMTRSSVRPGTHPALMSRYQQKKHLVYYGHSLIDWFDQVCSLEHIPRLCPGISRKSNWFITDIHWLIDLIKCVPWKTSCAYVQV